MKIILFLFLLATLPYTLSAQENKDSISIKKSKLPKAFTKEIKIGAGIYSLNHFAHIIQLNELKTEGYITNPSTSAGVYAFSMGGFFSQRVLFSISLYIENLKGRIEKNVKDSLGNPLVAATDYRVRTVGLLPQFHYFWKQSRMLNLYSGLGLGLNFTSYDNSGNVWIDRFQDSYVGLSVQATAIGVRYGDKYAGFAELGLGTLGLIRIGFSAGFQ